MNFIISVPVITVQPENKKIKSGTNVVLLCDAQGTPEPNFFWSKDDHTLKYSNRIYLATDNKTLNIDHIKESDAGLYACTAENILGSDEAVAQVDVTSSRGPPVLIFEPYDLEAIPGTSIELPCGAEGDPPPVVSLHYKYISHAHTHTYGVS
jgi:peroxidase